MTESTEIRIPFNDLTKITLECPDCSAEVALDLSNPKHRGISTGHRNVCPACGHRFDSKVEEAFSHIFNWYDSLKDTSFADKIYFRIQKNA